MADQIEIYDSFVQVELSPTALLVYDAFVQVELSPTALMVYDAFIQVEHTWTNPVVPLNVTPSAPTPEDTLLTEEQRKELEGIYGVGLRPAKTYAPWNFTSSPTVFGYQNNPLWELLHTATHVPCGYWPDLGLRITPIVSNIGRVICAACQLNTPYSYIVCTDKRVYRVHMGSGRIVDWIDIPLVHIDLTVTRVTQNFMACAIDQLVWLSKDSSSIVDKHIVIVSVSNGVVEAIRVDLVEWEVVGYSSYSCSYTSIRGGHTHGDYSVWGFDSSVVRVLNNITLEWSDTASSTAVPDFDAANRFLALHDNSGYERSAAFVTPLISDFHYPRVPINLTPIQNGEFENAFGGLGCGWWAWCVVWGYGHYAFAGYHPIYTRLRAAFSRFIINNQEIAGGFGHYIKHTLNTGGGWFLGYGWGVGGDRYIIGRVGVDEDVSASSTYRDEWNNKGQNFDSNYFGATMYDYDPVTKDQHLYVHTSAGPQVFSIPYATKVVKYKVELLGRPINPVWPFEVVNTTYNEPQASQNPIRDWLNPKGKDAPVCGHWPNASVYKRAEPASVNVELDGSKESVLYVAPAYARMSTLVISNVTKAWFKLQARAYVSCGLTISDTYPAYTAQRLSGTYVALMPEEEWYITERMAGDWQYWLYAGEEPSPMRWPALDRVWSGDVVAEAANTTNLLFWIERASKSVYRISSKWELIGDFDIDVSFITPTIPWTTQSPPMTIDNTYYFLVSYGYIYGTDTCIGVADRISEANNVITRWLDVVVDNVVISSINTGLGSTANVTMFFRITKAGLLHSLYYKFNQEDLWIFLGSATLITQYTGARIDVIQSLYSSHQGAISGYISKYQNPININGAVTVAKRIPRVRTTTL